VTQPTVPIVQVDAFTSTPFAGNPAAVCILPAPRDAFWMQQVAREMNLSETAFLHPRPFDSPLILSPSKDERFAQDRPGRDDEFELR